MTGVGELHGAAESLSGALDRVHAALAGGRRAAGAAPAAGASVPGPESWQPLKRLRTLFALSPFERDVVALCAGFSLESRFSAAVAAVAASGAADMCATLGMALNVLDDPHWSAVTAAGPLRYWQLLEVGRGSLLDAPLRLDERILQFLLGVPAFDQRLQALVRPIPASVGDGPVRRDAVSAGVRHWSRIPLAREPLLLIGKQRSAQQSTFAQICTELELGPHWLDAADIPADPSPRSGCRPLR